MKGYLLKLENMPMKCLLAGVRSRLAVIVPTVWLTLCTAVVAQQRVNGTVTEKSTGSPVAGVTVKLESDLLPSPRAMATAANGHFSFASLSPGRYTVSISSEKFYHEQTT